MCSSPFVSNPSRTSFIEDGNTFDQKQTISKFKFQIDSLTTEKEILKQEKESIIRDYEALLTKKSEEYSKLKANFDFTYEEKKQLESKLVNQSQVEKGTSHSLRKEIDQLRTKNQTLSSEYRDLETKYDRLQRKHQQVSSNWNQELIIKNELRDGITEKEQIIQQLQSKNDELIKQMKSYSDILNNKDSLSNINQSLLNKNASLQKINNQLQSKYDKLLQTQISNEVLKEKNTTLTNKLIHLQGVEEKCQQLDIEKSEIQAKFNDLFRILNESIQSSDQKDEETNTIKIKNFIQMFKESQARTLTLQEKLDDKTREVNELRECLEENMQLIEEEYLPTIESLESNSKSLVEQNEQLERAKNLNSREIVFLRNSLKELEEIQAKKQESENKTYDKATDQYLTNLEKLVGEYKQEIEKLQAQVNHPNQPSIGNKRPHPDDANKRLSFKSQVSDLERENVKLLTKIKQLESTVQELTNKLRDTNSLNEKRKDLQILQLKNNLVAKDQAIKKETLDALRNENQCLIDKYINNKEVDSIPRAVFERQENDKSLLQNKINELNRRITRFKEVYSKKSKDILTIISKYFGFTIEFLPSVTNPNELSSRLKLVSKYLPPKEKSYLVIDFETKALKAYGSFEFKSMCEEMAEKWVKEQQGQFPCLLSALNLKMYELYRS
ncbi:spindle assembly checkpoint component MAD1 [Spathaspora passalidarum NRRL Y-27907]|uniref:Spindle assembly checkpoint component MAD1 n=1 Tax=Spathaspora passalidarum (strain NRRL Y-27907 / 11-Y1) TaxID=619300 RepID=G3ANY6_SPAPN|nr:spindle assembly checkpoint component MAD1 [Spathaspora passalidarum NRRL Y-27907]EGW32611.1 spindle assembly checkpoint component MAD1 [Spathaspora passalidarum NRRL Y-27907]